MLSTAAGTGPARDNQLTRSHELLTARVERLQSSDDWRAALDVAARFHRYSFGNALLIFLQHEAAYQRGLVPDPAPGCVAGFHTWKALGRHVDKGQKGYLILCPSTRRVLEATAPDGGSRRLAKGEQVRPDETVSARMALRGWTTGHVFAQSQTSGADLPEPPRPQLLAGEAPAGLWDGLAERAEAAGFMASLVASADVIGGANGVTDFVVRTIEVRADMDPAAQVKTLSHELAHALLHAPPAEHCVLGSSLLHRGVAEVEAEWVAYLIGSAHGMDTTGYTLAYVASWAGGDDPATVVRATAERVITTARGILSGLDTAHGSGGRPPGVDETLARRPNQTAPRRRCAEPASPGLAL